MRDLRSPERYWWEFKRSWDITPWRLVNNLSSYCTARSWKQGRYGPSKGRYDRTSQKAWLSNRIILYTPSALYFPRNCWQLIRCSEALSSSRFNNIHIRNYTNFYPQRQNFNITLTGNMKHFIWTKRKGCRASFHNKVSNKLSVYCD